MSTQRQPDMKFDLTYPSDQIKIVQRLGEKISTDILVQVFNKGIPYNLAGMTIGFELRTDNNKIIIDKEQSRFTIVDPLKGVFSYRMHPNAQSFEGNAYIAYFTFEQGGARITTERFRVLNDEDVQNVCAPDLQQHYVSVIDDLVASNKSAMVEAQSIRDMINANQVVRKTGDNVTGPINFDSPFTVRGVGATFDMRPQVNGAYSKGVRHTVNTGNGFYALAPINEDGSAVWANQMQLDFVDGKFTVNKISTRQDTSPIPLVLSADGENPDASLAPYIVRKLNSVTITGQFRNKVGSASTVVASLPSNFRPPMPLNHTALATDGTPVGIHINPNGNLALAVKGKSVNLCVTYVI